MSDKKEEDDIPRWAMCPVCITVMHEPRLLTCGHSVCLKCQLQIEHNKCPTCRKGNNKAFVNLSLREAIDDCVHKKFRIEAAQNYEDWQVVDLSKKLLKGKHKHSVVFTKYDGDGDGEVKQRQIDLCAIGRYQYWMERKKDSYRMNALCSRYGVRVVKVQYTLPESKHARALTNGSILSEAATILPPGYTTIVREDDSIVYYVVYSVPLDT